MRTFEAAICEDQTTELDFLQKELQLAFQRKNFPIHIEAYKNGTTFLKNLSINNTRYDILFFDIEMPGINGIDLCRRIRNDFPDILIVFISNKEELVFQTFEVRPFHFVRKNYFSKELEWLTSAIINELHSREDIQISVQELHSNRVYTWNINQIIYVEALAKRCQVITEHNSINLQYRFMDFENSLLPHGFLKPHRSFLINYRYVSIIEKDTIILDNGKQLPISRNRIADIKTQFLQLINGGNHAV